LGLEGGPLSLVSAIEELLRRKSRGSCLENRSLVLSRGAHMPNMLNVYVTHSALSIANTNIIVLLNMKPIVWLTTINILEEPAYFGIRIEEDTGHEYRSISFL
jgi:hypothetical protein